MKFADLPVSLFTLGPSMPETTLSNHVTGFIEYLKSSSITPTTGTETAIESYVKRVDYETYSTTFNNYWDAQSTTLRTVESFLAVAIQGASLLFGRKPPEKTILRDIARAKVAERLLATYSE